MMMTIEQKHGTFEHLLVMPLLENIVDFLWVKQNPLVVTNGFGKDNEEWE